VPADVPAIAAIYRHHVLTGRASFEIAPPDDAEMLARFDSLRARDFPYLVACEGDAVRGYAYAGPYRPRPAYRFTVEDSIYVAPDAVGRGIGRPLLERLLAESEARGFRQMLAVIGDSGNAPSIRLHERCGFVRVGLLPAVGHKFGGWVDSVLMQRALGSGDGAPPDPAL
jgi:phosphinothricin acetyltransferase